LFYVSKIFLCSQFGKTKKFGKMTLHLHFTLKISADLFDSLELALSAQRSFENLEEFGLRGLLSVWLPATLKGRCYEIFRLR
jgi:hypothetical protein